MLEFQGYADKYIRYRSLNNMLLQICLKSHDDKPVIGIIVYTKKKYQTAALALEYELRGAFGHYPVVGKTLWKITYDSASAFGTSNVGRIRTVER